MYKDLQTYRIDFEAVMGKQRSINEYREGLEKFFAPGEDSYTRSPVVIGAVSANELTDYVVSSFLPTSGSWIDFELADKSGKEEIENVRKMQSIISDKLCESNFYSEIQQCIFNTLIYGQSIVSVDYSLGTFSFSCIDAQDIYVSCDSSIQTTRVYTRRMMSGLDIKEKFKNPPKFLTDASREAEKASNELYSVVTGYVPHIDMFFDSAPNTGYKIVHFMETAECTEVLEPVQEEEGYSVLPIAKFSSTMRGGSLGQLALPALTELHEQAIKFAEYSDRVVNPVIQVDKDVVKHGLLGQLGPGGIVPVDRNAKDARAIDFKGNLPFGIEERRRLEAVIKRIFKIDMLDQAKMQELSSMHVAGYKLNAVNAVAPLLESVFSKSLKSILDRCHSVLMQEDRNYRVASRKGQAEYVLKGIEGYKKSLENIVSTGRMAQTIAPFIQMNPQAAIVLDIEERVKKVAKELGLSDIIKSGAEIQDERAAIAAQKQQAQQVEQGQQMAQTQKLMSEAGNEGQG